MKPLLVIAAVLSLTGCATAPSSIQPIDVAPTTYTSLDTCDKLLTEHQAISDQLAKDVEIQESVAMNDAVGIALFGLPLGSVGDDEGDSREKDIALNKGRVRTLSVIIEKLGCRPSGQQ